MYLSNKICLSLTTNPAMAQNKIMLSAQCMKLKKLLLLTLEMAGDQSFELII